MRLIDAVMSDLINRDVVCDACMIEKGGKGCWGCLVNEAPAADAIEVVRCGKCIHYHWEFEPCHGKTIH